MSVGIFFCGFPKKGKVWDGYFSPQKYEPLRTGGGGTKPQWFDSDTRTLFKFVSPICNILKWEKKDISVKTSIYSLPLDTLPQKEDFSFSQYNNLSKDLFASAHFPTNCY